VSSALVFRRATEADIPTLRTLAERIWCAYYPAIIGAAQVEYMLARMYAEEVIRREIAEGVVWELALLGEDAAGFLSVAHEPDGRAKLNKLYLLPELHGRGHGQALIERACAVARDLCASELWLQVNKNNARALRAYERAGFRRTGDAVFDIGGGFVMDDYLLARALAGGA
jgi:ribosomal protein S18 acetylase RimI-like enzyme